MASSAHQEVAPESAIMASSAHQEVAPETAIMASSAHQEVAPEEAESKWGLLRSPAVGEGRGVPSDGIFIDYVV